MPEEEKEQDKLNRLEEMKTKMSTRDYETRIEHHGFFPKHDKDQIPENWEKGNVEEAIKDQNNFFMKTSLFKKFFIFSIIFFVLAVGYAIFMFLAGGNTVSNKNIEIAVLGKTFTAGGADLPLVIEITNKNKSSLDFVDLLIEYPTGENSTSNPQTERIRESIGSIPSGKIHNENINLVLFGEQGSTRQIKISIEYRVEGSNSIFVKEKIFEVIIDSTPINLLIDAPNEVSQNQDMTLVLKAILNANKPATNMLISIDYPPGFEFISSSSTPVSGNNVWSLGDLAPGAEQSISIVGKMVDVYDGEEKAFRVWSGSESKEDKTKIGVIFNSLKHNLIIKRPFIEAKLVVNGISQREYAVDSKTNLNGQIRWVNNLDTKINDLEIRAKLSGNALNNRTITSTDGFYNSLNGDVIIWDKNSERSFAEISPGDSGTVSFSLSSFPLYSASGGLIQNPTINIEVSITGKQALEGNLTQNIQNSESKIIRIISDVGFNNKALYYSGPFPNKGPIPPVVAKETTYTIVWSLSNTANPISKTKVVATLPQYMRFVGTVSPASTDIVFNPTTREIVWNAGSINKGAGITTLGKEVSFQVALIPSLSQLDTTPIIINEAVLTGHDDFANVDVSVKKGALNIRLGSDPQFLTSGAKVVE